MTRRRQLRNHLIRAWDSTIRRAYSQRLINSERGLQVYFCHRLLAEFRKSGMNRRIFVEPTFADDQSGDRRSPDIVICHTHRIIGVVELKYMPRVPPEYAKDLETLRWFEQQSDQLNLANDRYLGIEKPCKDYSLATDAVLCWAGIYRGQSPFDLLLKDGCQSGRYLFLHATTSLGKSPQVVAVGG